MASFYVRPDTSHSSTRNGLTYDTAWGGWSEIVWGTSGVKAGSDLYVCGKHTYATAISVGAHGGTVLAPVTIRGDYASSAGSIIFQTLTHTLSNNVANTIVQGFSSIAAISANGSAANCKYLNNIFKTPAQVASIRFGAVGDTHQDVVIDGNTFTTIGTFGTHSAVRWNVQTGNTSTFTRATITNNKFLSVNAARSVVQFWTQSDAAAGATMKDIICSGNYFEDCSGAQIEITSQGTTASADNASGVKIQNNVLLNSRETNVTGQVFGGGIGVWGFANTDTETFGVNMVSGNVAKNLFGQTGLVDAFYGEYIIEKNYLDGSNSSTIDGGGILLDLGVHDTIVRMNELKNCPGISGVNASGIGITVLDNVTNTDVYGNVCENVKSALHINVAAGKALDIRVYNNTCVGVTDYAIYISTPTVVNNITMVNNLFSGKGVSVRNGTASTWLNESFNIFAGFTTGTVNHVVSGKSITLPTTFVSGLNPKDNSVNSSSFVGSAAGVSRYSAVDRLGRPFKANPAIGAFEDYLAEQKATQTATVWAVNELGEVVMSKGSGSTTVADYLPINLIPVDAATGKIKVVFAD